MSRKIIPVSTLVHYLKGSLEGDPVLHGVLVEGEISNLRKPYSGHWYFSLKDSRASISCVMFASYNRRVGFDVQNGDKVEIRGDVSVYEPGGSLQIMANAMRRAGVGDLYQKFEELKKKLEQEGLFDASHKKGIPAFPFDIALVTGNNTAAREDVLITLKKRWPVAKISEYPAPVQGAEAAVHIIEELQKADQGNHDVILLVRGGGSIEDLWCFNDEKLARTVYDLKTPVVTGIGHETDFTLCDFTADLRANTPTGAVEAATPDLADIENRLFQYSSRLIYLMNNRLQTASIHLDHLSSSSVLSKPEKLVRERKKELSYIEESLLRFPQKLQKNEMDLKVLRHRFTHSADVLSMQLHARIEAEQNHLETWWDEKKNTSEKELSEKHASLTESMHRSLENAEREMKTKSALLDAYSPLKIMSRGYSIITKDSKVITSWRDIQKGDTVNLRLAEGSATALLQEVTDADKEHEI